MSNKEKILMHKDIAVCSVSFDSRFHLSHINEIYDISEMPLGYKNMDDGSFNDSFLSSWWKNNEIPTERHSVRVGLECLGINSVEELHWLGRGVSLNNHYWLKSSEETINWKDINFWDNPFSDEIGEALFNHKKKHTNEFLNSPDPALNGVLKKRWIYRKGDYYLEKGGSGFLAQEVYNEYLISRIFLDAGVIPVIYDLSDHNTCLCKAFTSNEIEFIPYAQIFESIPRLSTTAYPGENELEYFYRTLDYYNVSYEKSYIDTMLAVDYITANTDRHYNNIGLLKDSKGVLSLAPIYDNGSSLWNLTLTDTIDYESDSIMARPFGSKDSISSWDKQVHMIQNVPNINEEALRNTLDDFKNIAKTNSDFSIRRIDLICEGILYRYEKIKKLIKKKDISKNKVL